MSDPIALAIALAHCDCVVHALMVQTILHTFSHNFGVDILEMLIENSCGQFSMSLEFDTDILSENSWSIFYIDGI